MLACILHPCQPSRVYTICDYENYYSVRRMYLHQFDYIFAIGTMFAFLDAWNIGANDVANSFATSVSSRSLTYLQAMCIASVMECTGRYGID